MANFKTCILLTIILPFFAFQNASHPFPYDLNLTLIPGKSSKALIVFHGMGGSYQLAYSIKEVAKLDDTVIAFNLPDHGIRPGCYDPEKTHFGSIDELLPGIFVLKKVIIEEGMNDITLYGFSAGGGAIINTLVVLNTSTYDSQLSQIGISQEDKRKIMEAIQKGTVILDAPLKSVAEIIDFRGSSKELNTIGEQYRKNGMEPINALSQLSNLSLHLIVYFENPDEILSNRDDARFAALLKQANSKGTTTLLTGTDGGHNAIHKILWRYYTGSSSL